MVEYPEVAKDTEPKARKEHKCCECGGKIYKGEKYVLTKGIWDGEPATYKTCRDCYNLREKIIRDGMSEFYYTELREDAKEVPEDFLAFIAIQNARQAEFDRGDIIEILLEMLKAKSPVGLNLKEWDKPIITAREGKEE